MLQIRLNLNFANKLSQKIFFNYPFLFNDFQCNYKSSQFLHSHKYACKLPFTQLLNDLKTIDT